MYNIEKIYKLFLLMEYYDDLIEQIVYSLTCCYVYIHQSVCVYMKLIFFDSNQDNVFILTQIF